LSKNAKTIKELDDILDLFVLQVAKKNGIIYLPKEYFYSFALYCCFVFF